MNSLTPLLNVEHASRSTKFYTENLGFTVDHEFKIDGKVMWARLSRGPIAIMVNVSQERAGRGRRTDPQSYDDVVFYFTVDNAQEMRDALLRKGFNPGPLERQDYGVDEFTVRDPDGYELAFGSPIQQLLKDAAADLRAQPKPL
jgi:uncharacterized glyoxalase superfamily protein PhnB